MKNNETKVIIIPEINSYVRNLMAEKRRLGKHLKSGGKLDNFKVNKYESIRSKKIN